MSISLRSTALVHTDDITAAAGDAVDATALAVAVSAGKIAGLINRVTDEIERELNRRFIARAVTLRPLASDWMESDDEDYALMLLAPEWPVIEITDAEVAVVLGLVRLGGQWLYADEAYTEVPVYAGYRRHETDTLAELQAISGMSGADADTLAATPFLPDDIREACVEMVLAYWTHRAQGQFTGSRKVAVVGSGTVTVEGDDPRFLRRKVQSLYHHRRYA